MILTREQILVAEDPEQQIKLLMEKLESGDEIPTWLREQCAALLYAALNNNGKLPFIDGNRRRKLDGDISNRERAVAVGVLHLIDGMRLDDACETAGQKFNRSADTMRTAWKKWRSRVQSDIEILKWAKARFDVRHQGSAEG